MKIKDIEKSIKKENDCVQVPDVYASVKKAPINRLLTGETPIQAFEKAMATRLLAAVTVLLLVIAICVTVMWASKPAEQGVGQGYVSVTVENGITTRYSFVLSSSGNVLYATEDGAEIGTVTELDALVGKQPENAICELYQPKSGDKVTICVYYADNANARAMSSYLGEVLGAQYEKGTQRVINCYANLQSEKQHLVNFVLACNEGESVSVSDDIATLIEKYCICLSQTEN